MKGAFRWRFGESSQAELCRQYNLSEDQLLKWKQRLVENAVSVLGLPHGSAIQRGGRADRTLWADCWTVDRGVRHSKKDFLDLVELIPSEQRQIVEVLRTDYAVRQICEPLGFTRSNPYYQPRIGETLSMNRSQQLFQMGINDLKQAVLDVLSNEETIGNRFLKSDEIGDLLNIPKSPYPSLWSPIVLGILEQLKKDGCVVSSRGIGACKVLEHHRRGQKIC